MYTAIFSEISDLNPTHLETLAVAILSTLDGLPREAFEDVAKLAEQRGADWLASFHEDMTA